MGVINITPDSFSDGSQYNTKSSFEAQMLKAIAEFDIIDIGAESTAPMNSSISVQEEINRFKTSYLPFVQSHSEPNVQLSFDTYKIAVFEWLFLETRKYWPKIPIIFNDVAGKVDDELIALLKQYDVKYVFSHNLAPTRELTSNHMDYVQDLTDEDFLRRFESYFSDGLKKLENFSDKILIDPCFGFSKSTHQNELLLRRAHEILNKFSERIVYGVSRKSFLRKYGVEKDEYGKKVLDVTQSYLLRSFLDHDVKVPIFRIHDNASTLGLRIANELLKGHN